MVAHKGGGVGQTPDFWGNDYFDDTYFRSDDAANDEPVEYEGYCTDIWFDEAMSFIEESQASDDEQPFFAYLATNAPHGPYLVAEHYTQLYARQPRHSRTGLLRHDHQHRRELRPAARASWTNWASPTTRS